MMGIKQGARQAGPGPHEAHGAGPGPHEAHGIRKGHQNGCRGHWNGVSQWRREAGLNSEENTD